MPSPFVLLKSRLMAGTWGVGSTAVGPETPLLNITTAFSALARQPGNTVVATVKVSRTVNTETSCSVPWSVIGFGPNPVTSTYFVGGVLPSGTLSFGAGEAIKVITFSLSQGDRPSIELVGTFKLGTPTGAVLGPNKTFNFSLVAPLAFPTRVDPAEPGWINIPSYALSPSKVTFSTVDTMTDAVDNAAAGQTLVLTNSLDGGGATFTLDTNGTTGSPIFLRGNSDKKASFPELSNCTLLLDGTRWVICKLRLRNVRIVMRNSSYIQFQQNRFSGYSSEAITFNGDYSARYTLIDGNDFVAPFSSRAIFGSTITAPTNYKYIWIRRNLFKDFTDQGAIGFGPKDADAVYDCHIHIAKNLFKDYVGTNKLIDDGVAGIAIFDNTFERFTSTSDQDIRIRQGCTKPDQYTGNIIDGNLWVTPVSSTPPPSNWWQFTGMRSARANGRRSGMSYWGASSSEFATNLALYQSQVALCDAWNGGQPDAADATMDMVTGGPNTTDNDTITSGSNCDWSGTNSHWSCGWNGLPGGTIAIWACNLTSFDRRTDTGNGSIWTDIIAGTFDRHFTNMGRRIKKNFDTPALNPRSHLPSRLFIRMNHENNQSNFYRVLAAQKTNYVNAMNRAIEKIRIGLGSYANDVKFVHAPAHGSEGINLGSYASWCPSNVDAVSVSWHPRAAQNSIAALNAYNAGEDASLTYGLTELLAYSLATGKPMIFPEWSPRFEAASGAACPVADKAMDSFDAFLTANASRIICDCVYNKRTLVTNAYEPTDAAGIAAWANAVTVYKTKWSGTKA